MVLVAAGAWTGAVADTAVVGAGVTAVACVGGGATLVAVRTGELPAGAGASGRLAPAPTGGRTDVDGGVATVAARPSGRRGGALRPARASGPVATMSAAAVASRARFMPTG